MKILIVSKDPTHPTTAGNRWGILTQVNKLAGMGHEVHFLYVQELPLSTGREEEYRQALDLTRDFWGDRFHLFSVSKMQKLWFNCLYRFRMAFCSYTEGIDDNYPCGLGDAVAKLQKRYSFDACIVHYYFLSKLLKQTDIPVKGLFTHDCFAYKDQVVGEKILHITAHGEAMAMQRSNAVFAVQDEEKSYFSIIAPGKKVYTVYSHYDYQPQPLAGNHNLVFLSSGNPFNVNGLNYFLKAIYPAILKRFPDACLKVGGSICKCKDNLIQSDGVEYVGYVENPFDFYALGDVAINPVYQGTGLKIKTFEAVAYDKVTLVHPHSTKGIFSPENAPVLVADDADNWVSHLERVWGDEAEILSIKAQNAD